MRIGMGGGRGPVPELISLGITQNVQVCKENLSAKCHYIEMGVGISYQKFLARNYMKYQICAISHVSNPQPACGKGVEVKYQNFFKVSSAWAY